LEDLEDLEDLGDLEDLEDFEDFEDLMGDDNVLNEEGLSDGASEGLQDG